MNKKRASVKVSEEKIALMTKSCEEWRQRMVSEGIDPGAVLEESLMSVLAECDPEDIKMTIALFPGWLDERLN